MAERCTLKGKLIHYLDNGTNGLILYGGLVVPNASSIQLAVNAAGYLGGLQTVDVGAGTFGDSVEVWVDDLTLQGHGATTIIDASAVDLFANNGDVNTGFSISGTRATITAFKSVGAALGELGRLLPSLPVSTADHLILGQMSDSR
ncbi:MAG: hypothetical protein MO846_06325 [Candidatus Devosia symbiotica]|nr:hypothetical protein [Candidatus Devosia symbiotica]